MGLGGIQSATHAGIERWTATHLATSLSMYPIMVKIDVKIQIEDRSKRCDDAAGSSKSSSARALPVAGGVYIAKGQPPASHQPQQEPGR